MLTQWCASMLGAALLCSSRADSWFVAFDIVSDTYHPAPFYLNSDKLFMIWAINIVTSSRIQTWVLSLQLCLNIVDDLNRSATMVGLYYILLYYIIYYTFNFCGRHLYVWYKLSSSPMKIYKTFRRCVWKYFFIR